MNDSVTAMGGRANQSAMVVGEVEPTALPTPTAMPENPAEVGWFELGLGAIEGVIVVLIQFALVGIYFVARKLVLGEKPDA